MLNVLTGYSSNQDSVKAADEIVSKIRQDDIALVIFFASPQYDFSLLSKRIKSGFMKSEVIGCTTAGEICGNFLLDNSVVAVSISSKNIITATTVIKNISRIPIMHRAELINTFNQAGLRLDDPDLDNKGFVITLIDGLRSAEEKTLAVINSIFKNKRLPLIGGSAGDGLSFKETLVSFDGEVYSDAAVVTFINTRHKFYLYKENIFQPSGKQMYVTRADYRNRLIYELDNQPAAVVYADKLGVNKKDLPQYFTYHPLGRKIGDKIWIASAFSVNQDDSIQFYCQVITNSILEILEPVDPIQMAHKSVQDISSHMSSIKLLLAINCILRRLQFEQQNISKEVFGQFASLAPVAGFSSYGEQLNNTHLNQTLLVLALGE